MFSCWYRCSFWLESICEWLVWNPCPFVFAKLVFMDEYYNCKLSHVPHSMLTLNYMDMNYCWCWNCEWLIECASFFGMKMINVFEVRFMQCSVKSHLVNCWCWWFLIFIINHMVLSFACDLIVACWNFLKILLFVSMYVWGSDWILMNTWSKELIGM